MHMLHKNSVIMNNNEKKAEKSWDLNLPNSDLNWTGIVIKIIVLASFYMHQSLPINADQREKLE